MMTSQSLFNMEFSLQQESYLDEMFGLSADILAADLDTEGSILDTDLDGGIKYHQSSQESLEELLQSPTGGSFGEDWMETVDLKTLLNSNAVSVVNLSAAPVVPTTPEFPVVEIKIEEPRKEGMKASAFELLKALLTGNQTVKPELSLFVDHLAIPVTTPPVTSPVAEVPNLDFSNANSPINEVPTLDFTSTIADSVNFDMLLDEDLIEQPENPFEHLIEVQPTLLDNGDVEIDTSNNGPLIASIELVDTISQGTISHIQSTSSSGFNYGSPISDDDCDSDYSPPLSPDFSTIDSSQFSDDSASSSAKTSQVSEHDFTKLKNRTKKEKIRSSPYDPDYENIQDKKLRKKMQNKNAATRYRVKKRSEKETLQEQEVRLSDTNKELREKVDSLQREIKYMKELMNEINKAKQKKF